MENCGCYRLEIRANTVSLKSRLNPEPEETRCNLLWEYCPDCGKREVISCEIYIEDKEKRNGKL